ncbi:hypothetical protein PM082_023164 [Marasmius tenuissimus]|nr:hypothetical protein PM082_023164 [Marasmius tenuissimus]
MTNNDLSTQGISYPERNGFKVGVFTHTPTRRCTIKPGTPDVHGFDSGSSISRAKPASPRGLLRQAVHRDPTDRPARKTSSSFLSVTMSLKQGGPLVFCGAGHGGEAEVEPGGFRMVQDDSYGTMRVQSRTTSSGLTPLLIVHA